MRKGAYIMKCIIQSTTSTLRAATMLACMLLPAPALAAYPEKPLKFVVPFPPGGGADIMARPLAQLLAANLGQPVIIENRGGAGGTLGAESVATAAADGYTLFFGTMGTHAINVTLYPKLRYDPIKDFAPISLTHVNPRVLVVHPSIAAKSVTELIALARANPGKLSFSSAGSGSSSHLAGELFKHMAGIDMIHIPYKGSAPALNDLLGGRISMTFDSIAVYAEHIKSGKLRPLGVTSLKRIGALPDVPAIAESGLAGYDVSNWLGVMAPAATPKPIVNQLHKAVTQAMADQPMKKQLLTLGIEAATTSPEEFGALIKTEIGKWATIVKASGAKAD
jgi:tripartite-type tricarboxylate transporter receptor subunit TctC